MFCVFHFERDSLLFWNRIWIVLLQKRIILRKRLYSCFHLCVFYLWFCDVTICMNYNFVKLVTECKNAPGSCSPHYIIGNLLMAELCFVRFKFLACWRLMHYLSLHSSNNILSCIPIYYMRGVSNKLFDYLLIQIGKCQWCVSWETWVKLQTKNFTLTYHV